MCLMEVRDFNIATVSLLLLPDSLCSENYSFVKLGHNITKIGQHSPQSTGRSEVAWLVGS